jgi:conjugal transfer pilus assembly protein TraU
MHRQLMLPITSTSKLKEVCEVTHGMKSMTIKKSQYKLQLTYPKANAKGKHACNPLGRGQLFWQSSIEFPVKGEDFGYLVWRKRNCCAF